MHLQIVIFQPFDGRKVPEHQYEIVVSADGVSKQPVDNKAATLSQHQPDQVTFADDSDDGKPLRRRHNEIIILGLNNIRRPLRQHRKGPSTSKQVHHQ